MIGMNCEILICISLIVLSQKPGKEGKMHCLIWIYAVLIYRTIQTKFWHPKMSIYWHQQIFNGYYNRCCVQ